MKRLNRKGFTLVELLAVIVILAIVVGITLVTVLPTLKQSRQKAFELTAQTAADYYEKQYQLYLIGDTSSKLTNSTLNGNVSYSDAGLKSKNYKAGKYKVDTSTGRVCVKLQANKNQNEGAEYYDVSPEYACSSACTGACNSVQP